MKPHPIKEGAIYVEFAGERFKYRTFGRRYVRADGSTSDDLKTWHDPVRAALKVRTFGGKHVGYLEDNGRSQAYVMPRQPMPQGVQFTDSTTITVTQQVYTLELHVFREGKHPNVKEELAWRMPNGLTSKQRDEIVSAVEPLEPNYFKERKNLCLNSISESPATNKPSENTPATTRRRRKRSSRN